MKHVQSWTRWFAWRPVELQSGGCAWLRTVEYEVYNSGAIPYAWPGCSADIIHYRLPDDDPAFRMPNT
jgi:hypothetical protein